MADRVIVPERRPRCEVHIGPGTAGDSPLAAYHESTFGEPPSPAQLILGTRITPYIQSVKTVKTLTAPNGSFELTLTFEGLEELGRASLLRVVVPDNLVSIQLDEGLPSSTLQTVMQGWVTHVEARTSLSPAGQVQRAVTIRGEDAGKFLVRHQFPGFLFSLFMLGEQERNERERLGIMVRGTVGEVLKSLYTNVLLALLPVPVAARFAGLLIHPALFWHQGDPPTSPPAMESFTNQANVWAQQGRFWTAFRGLADTPWNEIYGDFLDDEDLARFGDYVLAPLSLDGVGTGFASGRITAATKTRTPGYYIVVRPQPFDEASWMGLRTHEVLDDELLIEHVRRGDDERINLVMVAPAGAVRASVDYSEEQIYFATAHFSTDSSRRHGTHPMRASSVYTDVGLSHRRPPEVEKALEGRGIMGGLLRERARRLWDWYSVNDQLWKGAMVIAGRPEVHVGHRVANEGAPPDVGPPGGRGSSYQVDAERERRSYYVERVIHDYGDGSHYHTQLALTRGQAGFLQAAAPDANFYQQGLGA